MTTGIIPPGEVPEAITLRQKANGLQAAMTALCNLPEVNCAMGVAVAGHERHAPEQAGHGDGDGDDAALIMYTSGSTGTPKGGGETGEWVGWAGRPRGRRRRRGRRGAHKTRIQLGPQCAIS